MELLRREKRYCILYNTKNALKILMDGTNRKIK